MFLGASIVAFATTPLGTAVVYVSTQLAAPIAHGAGESEPGSRITTAASDASDGDKFVAIGAPGIGLDLASGVVDMVEYCGLVPGTEYRLFGTIKVVAAGVATPSGVEGSTTFVPAEPCGSTTVGFEVDEGSVLRGQTGVVFETLVVAATGQFVAEHADPASADQTLYFPAVMTVMQRSIDSMAGSGDGIVPANPGEDRPIAEVGTDAYDVVTLDGLAPGRDYRAELTLYERLGDGTCVATEATATHDFATPPAPASQAEQLAPTPEVVVVGPVRLKEAGVFVGFERIYVTDDVTAGSAAATLVAAHENCDDLVQTIRVIEPMAPTPTPTLPGPPTAVETTSPTSTTPARTVMATTSTVTPTTEAAPTTGVPAARSGALPRTGSNARDIATAAALVATCGIGALAISRRRW